MAKRGRQAPSAMGRRIKRLRTRHGLTQRALAATARVTLGLIAQLELGLTQDVSASAAVRIAKALGTTVEPFIR